MRTNSRTLGALLTVFLATMLAGAALAAPVAADGTEELGIPSVPIESGSGVITAGTGTRVQPATINLSVPSGATIQQVLVYWEGQSQYQAPDSTINLNGSEITGTLIGGPTSVYSNWMTTTHRADITALGLITAGANAIAVSGMDFDRANGGAGLMVIYADGSESQITLFDGNDFAFANYDGTRQSTVAKTFTFAPANVDRTADLDMFFSSVHGPDHLGLRPSVLEVSVSGVVTAYPNVLGSLDGDEWDTFQAPVSIPAGASSVTVQAFSEDRLGTGFLPASLVWNAASLSIDLPQVVRGGEGCTPGYWGRPHHLGSWTGYATTDKYGTVFGVTATGDPTLLAAVNKRGGGESALMRHAVAALLNTTSSGVNYRYTTAQVISMVQSAYSSGDFETTKDELEVENESGCQLGRADVPGNKKKSR